MSLSPSHIAWKLAEDIIGDGLILKRVLRAGHGRFCEQGCEVSIDHHAEVEGRIFASSRAVVVVGVAHDSFFSVALRSMQEGERAVFWIDARLTGRAGELVPWAENGYEWIEDSYVWDVDLRSCASLSLQPESCIPVRGGFSMPRFGLGLYMVTPQDAHRITIDAIHCGYRLIDTASMYQNEASVGQAIRDSGVPRDRLFVVSKVNTPDHGYEQALQACQRSRAFLGVEQIDLYLIHAPLNGRIIETWDALLEARNRRWVRQIGVANFGESTLRRLKDAGRELPAVNQIEVSPFCQEAQLRRFCSRQGIVVMGYSPLTRGCRLHDKHVTAIASKHRRSNAQVLIRWALQQGIVTIPKTIRKERLLENRAVFDFELDDKDLKELSRLDESLHTCWDCLNIPWAG